MALISGKQLQDGSVPGTKLASTAVAWKDPVDVLQLVGNLSPTNINLLTPTAGDAYVVITASGTLGGTLAVAIGDLVEWDGTEWNLVVAQSGNFVPAGTRAVLATQTALIAPYTDGTHDGAVVLFNGTDLGTSASIVTGEATDGHVVVVNSAASYFANKGYIFDGAVGATAVWSQFTGAGQITAGAGLTKTDDTLNVGDAGKGVWVLADSVQVDASEIASSTGGLSQVAGGGNEHLLQVKLDTTTGAGTSGLAVGTNGVGIATGFAGNGLALTQGSPMTVKSDTTTAGNYEPIQVLANGVSLLVSNIAGNGVEADGTANLRVKLDTTTGAGTSGLAVGATGLGVAAALGGNGLTMVQGSAMTVKLDTTTGAGTSGLAVGANGLGVAAALGGNGLTMVQGSPMEVKPDVTTAANTQPVAVSANGVGLDINAIAGTGLEADGSANLQVKLDTTTGAGTSGLASGASGVGVAAGFAGNGLALTQGSPMTVKPDVTSAGDYEPVQVVADGVSLLVSNIAGTGLEADGIANLRIAAAAAGSGLTGGGGSALAIATAGENVTFTTSQWTWPADGLFVGTPTSPTAVTNKDYVDAQVAGLSWKNSVVTANLIGNVDLDGLVGNLTALAIEALTPANGDAYVVTTANGAGDLTTATVGDIWQYVTGAWVQVVVGSGGFVPNGTYCLLSTSEALVSPYTDSTHDGYRVRFNGTDNDPTDQGAADFFAPSNGDSYVIDGAGVWHEGAIHEWDTNDFVHVQDPAGGFVPAGTRAITGRTPAGVLILPYVEADEGKIVVFSGASPTGTDTGDAVDTASVLVQDPGHLGYFDNSAFVFEGTVPTGSWTQWNGGGSLSAGAGLVLVGNTLDVGDAGKGVQVNANDLEFAASEVRAAGSGLKVGASSWLLTVEPADFAGVGLEDDGSDDLRVKLDVTTGGGTSGLAVGANGLGVASALAGNGLALTQGSAMAVSLDTTTGGGTSGLAVGANGLGVASALAGDGLALTQGSAMTVKSDVTSGANYEPIQVLANGVSLLVSNIAGNGLQADGSANLQVLANGTSVSVGASGVKAAVPTSADKAKVPGATSGDGQTTTLTITATPAGDGHVVVKVNGIAYEVGNGVKTKDCFFSADAGSTAQAIADIAATNVLYWNGVIAGFDLAGTDKIDFDYNVIV